MALRVRGNAPRAGSQREKLMDDGQRAFYWAVAFVQAHQSLKWVALWFVAVVVIIAAIGAGAGPSDRDD